MNIINNHLAIKSDAILCTNKNHFIERDTVDEDEKHTHTKTDSNEIQSVEQAAKVKN